MNIVLDLKNRSIKFFYGCKYDYYLKKNYCFVDKINFEE